MNWEENKLWKDFWRKKKKILKNLEETTIISLQVNIKDNILKRNKCERYIMKSCFVIECTIYRYGSIKNFKGDVTGKIDD